MELFFKAKPSLIYLFTNLKFQMYDSLFHSIFDQNRFIKEGVEVLVFTKAMGVVEEQRTSFLIILRL